MRPCITNVTTKKPKIEISQVQDAPCQIAPIKAAGMLGPDLV